MFIKDRGKRGKMREMRNRSVGRGGEKKRAIRENELGKKKIGQ